VDWTWTGLNADYSDFSGFVLAPHRKMLHDGIATEFEELNCGILVVEKVHVVKFFGIGLCGEIIFCTKF